MRALNTNFTRSLSRVVSQVYKGDSFHLMPIITPAYPSMCATFNIGRSSMSIINRELHRGLEISEGIICGKQDWSDLFVKHTFFTLDYKYYVTVTSASKSKEAHNVWSGYVESKIRMLVQKLEQHPSIALAHVFNKGYDRRHRCRNDSEIAEVQEGSLQFLWNNSENGAAVEAQDSDQTQSGTAAEPHEAVQSEIFTTTHYIGLELDECRYRRQLCLGIVS